MFPHININLYQYLETSDRNLLQHSVLPVWGRCVNSTPVEGADVAMAMAIP